MADYDRLGGRRGGRVGGVGALASDGVAPPDALEADTALTMTAAWAAPIHAISAKPARDNLIKFITTTPC